MRYLTIVLTAAVQLAAQERPVVRLAIAPAEAQAAFLDKLEFWSQHVDLQKVKSAYKDGPPARLTEFGLSPEELAPIVPAARTFRASFTQVQTDLLAQRAANGDITFVLTRRRRIIEEAMTNVQKSLPPSAWVRLNTYLQQNATVTIAR